MAKSGKSYTELMALARSYGVADNAAVVELAALYQQQVAMLRKIRTELNRSGLTVEKEYVKDRPNLTAHPLIDAWIKGNTAAASTLRSLADTIVAFGRPPERTGGKLAEVLGGD